MYGIGAVVFKSICIRINEGGLGAGIGGGENGVSRVSGIKTSQKSTFFKMGVSLGRPHWKRDIIRIRNRWRRTGQQRVL